MKLLYSENEEVPNAAALNMDMKLRGFDRICIINVANNAGMKAVFPERAVQLTYRDFIARSTAFAREKDYRLYILDGWRIAIAAPSYLVSFPVFRADMEALQRRLFHTAEGFIALVPIFCVLDDCTVDNLQDAYNAARLEMAQKNIQFCVRDARSDQLDEGMLREQYHMVNVINYAITHDKVIPYFQGIYDNRENRIHHYESLMRLEDENGRVYYPDQFLDVARSFGLLYDTISKIMIRKVFERFCGFENRSVSINLGIRDIKNREIVELIYDFLPSVKHPENFVFEILENEDVDEYEYLLQFVEKIHSLGGRISIDDFGSGYSNLQHVVSIPSDYLKIDGSIIKKCCEDQESENLLALISGFKNLSSRSVGIIAEYVENEEIQNKLRSYGIDFSQGFLFSRPSPVLPEEC
jgi:EAL domain-containing protein (putative c-di-GMP-specific phosphodiesterase class I)